MNKELVTDYYKILSHGKSELIKQFIPTDNEHISLKYETSDPLDENRHLVTPRLIHRYKDRVLLLVTDECLLYCRHCFRRHFVGNEHKSITDSELDDVVEYIEKHSEVHEVILSGGDPLVLDSERLNYILSRICSIRNNIVIRIGTRVPIVDPSYISNELVSVLGRYNSIWLAIQCNHPNELTDDVKSVIDALIGVGVTVINQSVLLKGINDSVEILKALSHKLLEFRIKPYYIFQGDLATGTSHFRVPLKRGLEIISALRNEVSGLAMPTYAVDIPGGGGKVPLTKDYIIGQDEKFYFLKNSDGFVGKYPKEIE